MFTFLALIVAIVLLAWLSGSRAKNEQWSNRPYRLCTNCYTVGQPLYRTTGEVYCPTCQRLDPVPLESPWAREYFAGRRLVVPEQPCPPQPTQEERRNRIIGALVLLIGLGACGAALDHAWAHAGDLAASAAPAIPAAKDMRYTTDEYVALTAACGQPVSFKDKAQSEEIAGPDGIQREAKFRRVDFMFQRNSRDAPAWTLIGAFPIHGDDTLSRSAAEKLMPCLSRVHFQLGLPNDQ